ncbi:MAG: hypothetical protein BGO65_07700 [Afipia sp. 64-13]|nr:MAG: hypothetical protein BGO65_07700 [Afipia sp. 64-13]
MNECFRGDIELTVLIDNFELAELIQMLNEPLVRGWERYNSQKAIGIVEGTYEEVDLLYIDFATNCNFGFSFTGVADRG